MGALELLGTIGLSAIPQLFVGLFLLFQGVVILIQNPRSSLHRAFFILQLPVFVWLTGMGLAYNAGSAEYASILTKIGFLGVLLIPTAAHTFSVYYTKQLNQKKLMYAGWCVTLLLALMIPHSLFVRGVAQYPFGYYIVLGPLSYLVMALFASSIILFVKNLYTAYKKAVITSRRWQLLTLLSGTLAFLAIIDFLPAFGISMSIHPPGYLFIGALVSLMGYFIVRHRLSDLSIILGRTVGYFLLTVILFLIYVSIFLTLFPPQDDTRAFLAHAVFFIVILYGFGFLKEKSQMLIDRMFFKEKINFQQAISEFSAQLRNLTQPQTLLATLFTFLTETLRIEKSVVLIFQPQEMRWTIYKNDDHLHHKTGDAAFTRESQKFFIEHPELIDIRDCRENPAAHKALLSIERLLTLYKGRAALPLVHYGVFLGFIIIGKHSLLKNYSRRDTLALNHLGAPFSIAWSNAELYEDVQNASKLKDDFVSIASHQLRTPLTVIKWSLSLFQHKFPQTNEDAKELLETTKHSVEQMAVTINQLLAIARVEGESKKFPLARIPISLLIKEAEIGYRPLTESKHIALAAEKPEEKLCVLGNREHLATVLSVLLDNAVKYTPPKGKIAIAVKQDLERKRVITSVSDTGIGIPREEQDYIFKKFFRARNALSFRPDGSGLGLAYAKMLLEKQGGEMWFHSDEGKGTIFFISLPIARSRNL